MKTNTLTATDGMGTFLASCEIKTGSQWGARRIPAAFIKALDAMSPVYGVRLTLSTKHGPQSRTAKKIGNHWYTRVPR